MMMSGRKPVCFIFIRVPPEEVDVNVHPTKMEVKFRRTRKVHNVLLRSMQEALREAKITPQVSLGAQDEGGQGGDERQESVERAVWDFFGSQKSGQGGSPGGAGRARNGTPGATVEAAQRPQGGAEPAVSYGNTVQMLDSYLLEETEEGVNIIDQHALHERIIYNQLQRGREEGEVNSQQLLVPELVELPRQEFYAVMELKDQLADFGFRVEEFGESTVIVRQVPQIMRKFDAREFFSDLLDEFGGPDGLDKVRDQVDRVLKVIACKGAVKAGDRLGPDQIKKLLEQRGEEGQTDTCPHGRPTTILLNREELEKQFRRT
jgi:DNA mismatch repair protein MutL